MKSENSTDAVLDLRRNLTRELVQQSAFLELLGEHRRAMLAFDAGRLESSSAQLAEAAARGAELHRERAAILQRLALLMGVEAGALRVGQIARAAGDSALEELRRQLAEMSAKVDRTTRSVFMLNRCHADAYSTTLRILLGNDPLDLEERRSRGGLLVNREA